VSKIIEITDQAKAAMEMIYIQDVYFSPMIKMLDENEVVVEDLMAIMLFSKGFIVGRLVFDTDSIKEGVLLASFNRLELVEKFYLQRKQEREKDEGTRVGKISKPTLE
jgi:hypothetical protein